MAVPISRKIATLITAVLHFFKNVNQPLSLTIFDSTDLRTVLCKFSYVFYDYLHQCLLLIWKYSIFKRTFLLIMREMQIFGHEMEKTVVNNLNCHSSYFYLTYCEEIPAAN